MTKEATKALADKAKALGFEIVAEGWPQRKNPPATASTFRWMAYNFPKGLQVDNYGEGYTTKAAAAAAAIEAENVRRAAVEVCKEARRRFEPDGSWTRNAWARDGDCIDIDPFYDGACSFCISGMLRRVIYERVGGTLKAFNSYDAWEVRNSVTIAVARVLASWDPDHFAQYMGQETSAGLMEWNDHYANERGDVIRLLDETVERLEGRKQ